jgi:predicted  nucleic acid-binding Zn-ribbon protein
MNIAFQLYQVQHIDSEIDRADQRIKEIQKLIGKNTRIASAEQKLDKCKQAYIRHSNEFNEINAEIEKKKIKKNQSQSSLYSGKVQNPKELEDLQHEIDSLGKAIAILEDSLMQALITLDNAEKDLETAKTDLQKTRSAFATELSMLTAEKEKLIQKIEGLQSKRAPVYGHIDEQYQAQYETLRKRKKGIAVSLLNDSSCDACGANLTASQRQAARSSHTLFICPNCGRIIYGSA